MHAPLILQRSQIRQLLKLLVLLEVHLESAIETSLLPGTTEPQPEFAHNVEIDRRDWRAAEDFIMLLGGKPRKRGAGIPHPPFPGKGPEVKLPGGGVAYVHPGRAEAHI